MGSKAPQPPPPESVGVEQPTSPPPPKVPTEHKKAAVAAPIRELVKKCDEIAQLTSERDTLQARIAELEREAQVALDGYHGAIAEQHRLEAENAKLRSGELRTGEEHPAEFECGDRVLVCLHETDTRGRADPRLAVIHATEDGWGCDDPTYSGYHPDWGVWWMRESDAMRQLERAAPPPSEVDLGKPLVSRIRLAFGWGMRAFAQHAGLLPSRWSEIESGKSRATDEEVRAIARALVPENEFHAKRLHESDAPPEDATPLPDWLANDGLLAVRVEGPGGLRGWAFENATAKDYAVIADCGYQCSRWFSDYFVEVIPNPHNDPELAARLEA